MYNFLEKTKKILSENEWNENRKFDSQPFIEYLNNNEFIIHKTVLKFLNSFGGLNIIFEKNTDKDNIEFNPIKANEGFHTYWIKENYHSRTNSILCPIGIAYRNHMIVSMDELGYVYGGYDDTLIRLGKSGEEAIDNICNDCKDLFIEID